MAMQSFFFSPRQRVFLGNVFLALFLLLAFQAFFPMQTHARSSHTSAKSPLGRVAVVSSTYPNFTLSSFDSTTGLVAWTFKQPSFIGQPSEVSDGKVFVPVNVAATNTATLYTLDALSGAILATRSFGPGSRIAPQSRVHLTSLWGRVLVALTDGTLYALSASTGEIVWQLSRPGACWGSSTSRWFSPEINVYNEDLFLADTCHNLFYTIDSLNGHVISSFSVARDGSVDFAIQSAQPLISSDGTVFFVAGEQPSPTEYNFRIYAVNPLTGQLRWSWQTDGGEIFQLATDGDYVYAATSAFRPGAERFGQLIALNISTHQLAWHVQTPTSPSAGPSLLTGGSFLYIPAADRLYKFSLASKTFLWQFVLGTPYTLTETATIVASNPTAVYLAFSGLSMGRVYKIDEQGHSLWPFYQPIGPEVTTAPLVE